MTSKKLANRYRVVTTLLAFVLVLSMSTMLIQKATAQYTHYTTISGFNFIPQNRIIPRGSTGVWSNNDPVIHTLWFVRVSDRSTYLLSSPIIPGATWSNLFTEYVELEYYDLRRLWISGTLLVTIPGDVDGSRRVGIGDGGTISDHWTGPPTGLLPYHPNCDIDGDGRIGVSDGGIISDNWGQSW